MAHVVRESLHAFRARALDVQVDVDTDVVPGDFSLITFRVDSRPAGTDVVTKAGLTASAGGTGILVDVFFTAADLDLPDGIYDYELFATVGGEVRTLAQGALTISPEPTT